MTETRDSLARQLDELAKRCSSIGWTEHDRQEHDRLYDKWKNLKREEERNA